MTPLVSIVVPVYNVPEKYLKKCIDSLQNQTLQLIEIILVDDGSTNEAGNICDQYAKEDSRIRVVHKINGGLSAARNTGVRVAVSQWITLIDGDDWIEKETLKTAYEFGQKANAEIVCWGAVKDYGNHCVPYNYENKFQDGKLYCGDECKYMREMLLHYNGHIATAYAKMIRRDYIEKWQIYHDEDLKQGAEGLEFCLKLFNKADRILFLNKHWYHYMYNPNSISSRTTEENNELILLCFEKIYKMISNLENSEDLMPWFYNRLLYVVITTAISGYFHPENKEKLKVKKKKYKNYLHKPLIEKVLKYNCTLDISFQRKVILFLIRKRWFVLLDFMARIRYRQKINKI